MKCDKWGVNMEEIKIGEYVRTVEGTIGKIEQPYELFGGFNPMYAYAVEEYGKMEYETIVKHSFNLIDLIEKGDYVNGMEVIEHPFTKELYVVYDYVGDNGFATIKSYSVRLENIDIEDILTHEEYNRRSYKVEE